MKTYVIGDIHGHYTELMNLMYELNAHGLHSKQDRVVFVGDYVDGGPDTKKVLNQLVSWKQSFPHWVFLRGNHEDLLLDALVGKQKKYGDYYIWYNQGGRQTVDSYKRDIEGTDLEKGLMKPIDIIPGEHLQFLLNLPLYFEDENAFYVHGGVPHGMTLENFKKEIDKGNNEYELKAMWIRDEFINSPTDWGKKVIYGHTATREPNVQANKIGIDTMPRDKGK